VLEKLQQDLLTGYQELMQIRLKSSATTTFSSYFVSTESRREHDNLGKRSSESLYERDTNLTQTASFPRPSSSSSSSPTHSCILRAGTTGLTQMSADDTDELLLQFQNSISQFSLSIESSTNQFHTLQLHRNATGATGANDVSIGSDINLSTHVDDGRTFVPYTSSSDLSLLLQPLDHLVVDTTSTTTAANNNNNNNCLSNYTETVFERINQISLGRNLLYSSSPSSSKVSDADVSNVLEKCSDRLIELVTEKLKLSSVVGK